jgi:PAS domain S-box-containing protein
MARWSQQGHRAGALRAWRKSHAEFLTRWGGPCLTAGTLVVVALLSETLGRIPDAFAIVVLTTVFATFTGGRRAGLVSAGLTVLYLACLTFRPGAAAGVSGDDPHARVVVWAAVLPVMVLIIALMKRRGDEASNEIVRREREHSVALATSLAEHTRAETALRALFERNLAGIFRSRRDGRILECNSAFVELVGATSRDEVLARNAREFYVHPEDREHVLKLLQPGVVVTNHELEWRRADGNTVWVLVNVREVSEGTSGYLEGIVLDVTDRRRRG